MTSQLFMTNNLKIFSYTLIVGLFLISPSFASADSRVVCKEIKEREENAESIFEKHELRFLTLENEIKDTVSTFEQTRLSQKNRSEEILKKHISTISRQGDTDLQKKAVASYLENLKRITAERTASIEKAQQEYKDAIKAIFEQKKSTEKVLLDQYKQSSKRAFENSLRDCEKGRPAFIFKRELRKEIENGHRIFNQQINTVMSEQGLELLRITRNQKIETAQNTFSEKHAVLMNTLRASLLK
jgi:hypothetical protein